MTLPPPDLSILQISHDLVPPPLPQSPRTTSLSFDNLLSPPLLLQEDPKEGCGGQLWPAGMLLASYLLRCKLDSLVGKTMIELGAGSGLVGLTLALALPPTNPVIHLTDQLPLLPLLTSNIHLNALTQRVISAPLSWGAPIPLSLPHPPQILLAADCVYYEPAFPLLMETMLQLIGPKTMCYFCFKKRRRADMGFLRALKKGFCVRDVRDDPERQIWEREGLFLFEVTMQKADSQS